MCIINSFDLLMYPRPTLFYVSNLTVARKLTVGENRVWSKLTRLPVKVNNSQHKQIMQKVFDKLEWDGNSQEGLYMYMYHKRCHRH